MRIAYAKGKPPLCSLADDVVGTRVQSAYMAKSQERNHLRAWRDFREMTQAQLAEAVGTTGAVISNLEVGERGLSDKWLRRLAPALGTTPGTLLDHAPTDLPADVLDVWTNIPEDRRAQALDVLRTFRTGDRRMRALVGVLLAAGLATSGCVSGLGRMNEYGKHLADAKTKVGRDTFSMWVHPKEDSILIQKGFGASMGQSFMEGASLGTAHLQARKTIWEAAANWLVTPLGCKTTDAYSIDNRITWEATYTCPAGVDLRGEVASHRTSLRQGVPLTPVSP